MIKEKEKLGHPERRKTPRIKGDFLIEIANQKSKIIPDTINISVSGMYYQTDTAIPLFREISMTMFLPDSDTPLECSGVVVRSEKIPGKNRHSVAVFFDDISPEHKDMLAKYVEKKMAG